MWAPRTVSFPVWLPRDSETLQTGQPGLRAGQPLPPPCSVALGQLCHPLGLVSTSLK